MSKQKYFNFKFSNFYNYNDFYVNETNTNAVEGILDNNFDNKFLIGPNKSGKTFLGNIWLKKNKAINFNKNFNDIINNKKAVFIDDIEKKNNEEEIFHIINHCKLYKIKILVTSNLNINEINFSLKDLISRLKSFSLYKIENPDDDMLLKILTKLFVDKQFVINSNDIFPYILKRANRSYEEMIFIVEKLDSLSLEKKRQLTIPLIKEIL